MNMDRRLLAACACEIARTVLHLVPAGEDRPRVAIETRERWIHGDATEAECDEAAWAAWHSGAAGYDGAAWHSGAAGAARAAEAAGYAWAAGAAEAARAAEDYMLYDER